MMWYGSSYNYSCLKEPPSFPITRTMGYQLWVLIHLIDNAWEIIIACSSMTVDAKKGRKSPNCNFNYELGVNVVKYIYISKL